MNEITIKSKIHTIRGKQVMLDSDLAELYKIPTKRLNEQVKRNVNRFPHDFMFKLTENEVEFMGSQIATSIKEGLKTNNNDVSENKGGRTYLPYVFTEQGVAMLSGILRSEIAIKVNIQIMRAFIQMKNFLQSNAEIFQRLDKTEQKLLIHDNKIEEVFNLIQEKDIKPQKGIFFDGQIFEAYKFINDLIKSAKQEILLIDNFVDETTLTIFSKTKVKTTIYTKEITNQLKLDLAKYNQQYRNIQIKEFNKSHDRFLIIDKEIFHIGASLKDLGKKWFAFSKFEDLDLLSKLP
ncbi:MAG: ORF6N domain-containing protein [Candidatus Nanoarchaeia archaeon]|nr:ORF6N domain-containing protein [Candidatus Nanoarchaeia archaeon]